MSNRSRWWHIDIEDLRTVTQRSSSFVEIIRHYGFVASGSGFRMLRSRLDSLKIDYSHIPVGLGANRGRAVFQPELGIEQVFVENSLSSRKTVKKYLLQHKLMEYKCVICGQEPSWLDKPLTLVLDHINGKNNDHRLENLRFLCPNCNSQTDTFGSRNFKQRHFCKVCNIKIPKRYKSGKCAKCLIDENIKRNQSQRRPHKDELKTLVWKVPTTQIAKQFGVSDRTIADWCNHYGIKKPGPGYWMKLNSKSRISEEEDLHLLNTDRKVLAKEFGITRRQLQYKVARARKRQEKRSNGISTVSATSFGAR